MEVLNFPMAYVVKYSKHAIFILVKDIKIAPLIKIASYIEQ
ncbi:hypothetical protein B602_0856 [Chlamydia psittaci M56]|nr:hypothetical protein B602_0856 [Chlamydia psittaci M56]